MILSKYALRNDVILSLILHLLGLGIVFLPRFAPTLRRPNETLEVNFSALRTPAVPPKLSREAPLKLSRDAQPKLKTSPALESSEELTKTEQGVEDAARAEKTTAEPSRETAVLQTYAMQARARIQSLLAEEESAAAKRTNRSPTLKKKATFRLTIGLGGSITRIELEDSSGSKEWDQEILAIMQKAGTFGQLPAGIPELSLRLPVMPRQTTARK